MTIKSSLSVKILTSDGNKILKHDLHSVLLDTDRGKISILQHHIDMVVILSVGVVVLTHPNQTNEIYLVNGGSAITRNSEVIIITDFFLEKKMQNKQQMLQKIKLLEYSLSIIKDSQELRFTESEITKYRNIYNLL